MRKNHKIKSIHQVFTLLKVFMVLCISKVSLLILSFSALRKIFAKLGENKPQDISFIIFCINGISNHLPVGFTCLPKALALKYFMSYDNGAILVVGVKFSNQSLEAHAWVEKEGEVLIGESTVEQFTAIWQWQ
jgi:hypothetical protein